MSLGFTEKYRPKTLNDMHGNHEVLSCLKSFDCNNLPNMLFYGPPGTGKTTAIRALLSLHPIENIIELNASDSRGIDVVRDIIKEFATTKSVGLRIVVLDEADSMSKDAQAALRRIMEDYEKTRFCIICNYVKKIIDPIVSRCSKFRFAPVKGYNRLVEICLKEGIKFEKEGLEMIEKYGGGDMRKMINDVEGISGAYLEITKKNVLEFFGIADFTVYERIYEMLESMNFDSCKKFILEKGLDVGALVSNLSEILIRSMQGKDLKYIKNRLNIIKLLADLEQRIDNGCSDSVQLNALIAAFILNK